MSTERARAISLPADREILHLLPQEFILDDQSGVHDPLGQFCGLPPTAQEAPDETSRAGGERQQAAPKRAQTRPMPFLERFGRDLTQLARDGKLDPVIGRREERRSLARVLTQKRKSNAILVGEAGVGKTCVSRAWPSGSSVPMHP